MSRAKGQFEQFGNEVREPRLRWFGHVQMRNSGYVVQSIPTMELEDRTERGRRQRRFRRTCRSSEVVKLSKQPEFNPGCPEYLSQTVFQSIQIVKQAF